MPEVTPVIGLALYAGLILGAALSLRINLVTSISGVALLIYASARCCWEATRLFTPLTQGLVVLSALSDGVAGISFYAFLATLLLRTGFVANSADSFGMWRVGSRPVKMAKASILLWLMLVVGVTCLEMQCLVSQSDSLNLPTDQCAWHNRFERLGLAFAALLAAVALGVLGHRVLLLHKQSATKVGKPSKAFILALGACGAALLGRVATLIFEATTTEACDDAPGCFIAREIAAHSTLSAEHEVRRILLDLFGNWLPELLPPLLLWRLMRVARKLHRRRNRQRDRQRSGGSSSKGSAGLKGAGGNGVGEGNSKHLWGTARNTARILTMPKTLLKAKAASLNGGMGAGGIEMGASTKLLLDDDGAHHTDGDDVAVVLDEYVVPSEPCTFKSELGEMLVRRKVEQAILTRTQFEYTVDDEHAGNREAVR